MEKGSPSPNSADAWDEKFVERSNLVNAFSIPEDAIVEDPPAPLYFRSLRDTADAPRYSLSSSSRSSFSVEGGISDQFGPSSSHSTRASDDSKAENYKLGKQHSRKASAAWNDDLCLENHNPRSGIFWNSTSSLYVKSTMGKPDISRAVRCLSGIIFNMIEPNSEAETPFDEPLEYWKRRMPNDKHALYRYILNIFVDAQLTCECIIMSMVYLDRVLMALNIDLTPRNLRPLILCSFLLASKVWDDVSMWNVDFCEIYPRYNLRLLNKWESEFLVAIGFDVSVSASMYAEYYFNLRMEEIKINGGLETESHIRPLDPEQSKVLEAVSRKSCENLMAIGSRQRSNTGANNQTFSNRFVLS